MLLRSIVGAEIRRNFPVDFVPRPADLMFQIAAREVEIFVEFLCATGEGMGSAHTLTLRQALERQEAATVVDAAARGAAIYQWSSRLA